MKEFDIFLNNRLKEYDLVCGNRLTECDIIVYSIPFRDSIGAANGLIIDTRINAIPHLETIIGDVTLPVRVYAGVEGNVLKEVFCKITERNAVAIDSLVGEMLKRGFVRIENSIAPSARVENLYHMFENSGSSALSISANVNEVGLCYPLGSAESGTVLNAAINDDAILSKYLNTKSAFDVKALISEHAEKSMALSEHKLLATFSANCVIGRYRIINEMDLNSLATYNDMPLNEVDFITM